MTTHAISAARPATALTLAFTAMLGVGILWMAGHAQAAALHDAAHDVRHATGFPCH
ncbi:CbtB-domain containing protein [Silicimonas algicola]|uniref:Cobalt transporter subunit CbtB n=1 Tax=Silicimonas algicola TaxID=1826607 RepID=A0A316G8P4_9RHOB|nr:CbtB-domain containing protein [Silicimonas algicola]AZQ67308.1 CbtB-domain containing protein [Silicimonas algicola]PWK56982.1 cobalt transporter subunit CbtB [Silicimonas algicola]